MRSANVVFLSQTMQLVRTRFFRFEFEVFCRMTHISINQSINQSINLVYCTELYNTHTRNLTNKYKRKKTFIDNINSTTWSSERA